MVQPLEIAPLDLWKTVTCMSQSEGRPPDFARFERALTTRDPGPVPFGDLFADHDTIGNFLKQRIPERWGLGSDAGAPITVGAFHDGIRFADQTIQFCLQNDWDYAFSFSTIPFQASMLQTADNTSPEVQGGKRYWIDDNRGPIGSWEDFERYPWPADVQHINFLPRVTTRRVPEGM